SGFSDARGVGCADWFRDRNPLVVASANEMAANSFCTRYRGLGDRDDVWRPYGEVLNGCGGATAIERASIEMDGRARGESPGDAVAERRDHFGIGRFGRRHSLYAALRARPCALREFCGGTRAPAEPKGRGQQCNAW